MNNVKTHTFTGMVSKTAHARLEDCLEQLRQLYNAALQERKEMYTECGWSPSYQDQCKWITALREHNPDFAQFLVRAQRTALLRVDEAYKGYFRRCKEGKKPGYPRFKSKGRVRSVELEPKRIHTSPSGVHSFKVGGIGRIRFKGELPEGKYKLVRLVKTPKRIKVQFVVEELPREIMEDERETIGIDLGVKARVTLSNGWQSGKNEIKRGGIKRKQRAVSRAKPGSKSRAKKVDALRREWQSVAEHELGVLHELTAYIIAKHGAKIYVEDLNIEGMVKNHALARSIMEQQWGKFIELLTYKAEEAGGWVRKVNPRNTSKTCSLCGSVKDLTLKDRVYECDQCGHVQDRDWNAAINVRQKGELIFLKPGGNSPARGANDVVHTTNGEGLEHPVHAERCA